MKALPTGSYWSLVNTSDGLRIFNSPKKIYRILRDSYSELLSGEFQRGEGLQFLSELMSCQIKDYKGERKVVFHAFYELGHLFTQSSVLKEDTVLGYWLEFSESAPFEFHEAGVEKLTADWKYPEKSTFLKSFYEGEQHLREGDCYQYNLTFPFYGKIKDLDLESFLSLYLCDEKQRGRFSSYTHLGDIGLFSNSPECLFELIEKNDQYYLDSKPIKGTLPLGDRTPEEVWEELDNSSKNESELFMIADLLRNDLNLVGESWVEVLEKKAPLPVKGLMHSYTHLRLEVNRDLTLQRIMTCLFPGGSITGAPKKRVMSILRKLEQGDRGFYCGSTILFGGGHFQASINIRSGVLNHNDGSISYNAGCGITIKSEGVEEYLEMSDKFHSFRDLVFK